MTNTIASPSLPPTILERSDENQVSWFVDQIPIVDEKINFDVKWNLQSQIFSR